MSWVLAVRRLRRPDHPPRARPLRRREGRRDAGRALLPLLPAEARRASRAARPSTAIGAIPLGGFVKITGMNPEEELPPEVAPRAYYHQPVWKRIVVIGAGPAVNLADRLRDPASSSRSASASRRTEVGERRAGLAGGGARSSPATGSLAVDGRAARATRRALTRSRAGREPQVRRRADRRLPRRDAGRADASSATARPSHVCGHARATTPRRSARGSASPTGRRPLDPASRRRAATWSLRPDVGRSPRRRSTIIAQDLRPRAAQADLRRRRQLRGDAAGDSSSTPARRSSCSR